jgi:hypothetical protein
LDGVRRVASSGDVDSMIRFQLKRGGVMMKHYRKIKQRQRAHLGSMRRKCDMTQQHGDVGWSRDDIGEGQREETTPVGLT